MDRCNWKLPSGKPCGNWTPRDADYCEPHGYLVQMAAETYRLIVAADMPKGETGHD